MTEERDLANPSLPWRLLTTELTLKQIAAWLWAARAGCGVRLTASRS